MVTGLKQSLYSTIADVISMSQPLNTLTPLRGDVAVVSNAIPIYFKTEDTL